jgi:NTP pyrophosphatase (non-canonical NTP hydrolase)
MELREYQTKAMSTAIYPRHGVAGLAYVSLGLNGEAGEVAEVIKKIIRDDEVSTDRSKLDDAIDNKLADLSKEIGDVLWYVAALCTELGLDMNQIASDNIEKLQSRKNRNVIKGSGSNR